MLLLQCKQKPHLASHGWLAVVGVLSHSHEQDQFPQCRDLCVEQGINSAVTNSDCQLD